MGRGLKLNEGGVCMKRCLSCDLTAVLVTGSLGARVTELKQKVIAENPRRYGLAVPRESDFFCSHTVFKKLYVLYCMYKVFLF